MIQERTLTNIGFTYRRRALRSPGAEIANAIFNASGVGDYRITLDKLIGRLPSIT